MSKKINKPKNLADDKPELWATIGKLVELGGKEAAELWENENSKPFTVLRWEYWETGNNIPAEWLAEVAKDWQRWQNLAEAQELEDLKKEAVKAGVNELVKEAELSLKWKRWQRFPEVAELADQIRNPSQAPQTVQLAQFDKEMMRKIVKKWKHWARNDHSEEGLAVLVNDWRNWRRTGRGGRTQEELAELEKLSNMARQAGVGELEELANLTWNWQFWHILSEVAETRRYGNFYWPKQ